MKDLLKLFEGLPHPSKKPKPPSTFNRYKNKPSVNVDINEVKEMRSKGITWKAIGEHFKLDESTVRRRVTGRP